MKRSLAILLVLTLCFGNTACARQEISPTGVATQAPPPLPTETVKPITYTYKAQPIQNAQCDYSASKGQIMVWTQCPNCGEENISAPVIEPAEQDFSFGDTIMHSDTASCWDCSWDKGIDQFMWSIQITRVPE